MKYICLGYIEPGFVPSGLLVYRLVRHFSVVVGGVEIWETRSVFQISMPRSPRPESGPTTA